MRSDDIRRDAFFRQKLQLWLAFIGLAFASKHGNVNIRPCMIHERWMTARYEKAFWWQGHKLRRTFVQNLTRIRWFEMLSELKIKTQCSILSSLPWKLLRFIWSNYFISESLSKSFINFSYYFITVQAIPKRRKRISFTENTLWWLWQVLIELKVASYATVPDHFIAWPPYRYCNIIVNCKFYHLLEISF